MKIKLDNKVYESIKLTCGVMENYFDIIEQVQEKEEQGKMMSKTDRLMIKEFLCTAFGNQFTTDDIDSYLEFSDLVIYFRTIGEEITEKTNKKFEKLAKK